MLIWARTKKSTSATCARFGMSQDALIEAFHIIRKKLGLADGASLREAAKVAARTN